MIDPAVVDKLTEIMEAIFGPVNEDLLDADLKFQAEMLLSNRKPEIIVPTKEEWMGVNLLDLDSELKRRKK